MNKFQKSIRYFLLKLLQVFGLDFIAENKQLHDRNVDLEKQIKEIKNQASNIKLSYISERELPVEFKRIKDNILLSPEKTSYCWNCYNKQEGGEFRVLFGDEYFKQCKVCGIYTRIKTNLKGLRSIEPDKNNDIL
ncbi:MAG: hypothetical protein ABIG64_03970 [Candidatus Omnitrophota bacterium]